MFAAGRPRGTDLIILSLRGTYEMVAGQLTFETRHNYISSYGKNSKKRSRCLLNFHIFYPGAYWMRVLIQFFENQGI